VARIGKLFPAWEQNPLETDALAGVRRSFHTLKGSGRMVGATDVSEFAWSIENLLNRIIENTLQRSPAILATVRDSVVMAGELVNALEAGKARARAHAGHHRSGPCAGGKQGPRPRRPRPTKSWSARSIPGRPTCSKPRDV
jgi:chemosensory pili system protein ChpA (sensor histidine kinase/response regulator)